LQSAVVRRHISDRFQGAVSLKGLDFLLARAGDLWLIIGPSGVGKDSLIDGAKAVLGPNPGFAFPRREITRPADAGGEDHIAITMQEFQTRRGAGDYALSWTANGLGYGVSRAIDSALGEGRRVVMNGSRGALGDARSRYPDLHAIEITVPPEILRARLEARGRESPTEIEARLERAAAIQASGDDVIRFNNDRPLPESIDALVALLTGSPA
jgi:ribose 1,5-bisphosphokinase